MNVGELKKELEKYPDNLDVYVDGYEGGIEDLVAGSIFRTGVARNVHTESYYGKHAAESPWGFKRHGLDFCNDGLVLSRDFA